MIDLSKILFVPAFILLIAFSSCRKHLIVQNETPPAGSNATARPPLNDLGTGYWRGLQGGLYPGGSNGKPAAHLNAGLQLASEVRPLSILGTPDPITGKIVWLSIGMSNTTQETQVFISMADALPNKNPSLVLVDGAQGGWDIDMINQANAAYWSTINSRLSARGLSPAQVQVIWFKQADRSFPDTSFAGYTNLFKAKLQTAMDIMKSKFPNAKLCYLSSRIYGGYQTGTGSNPEPFAYYTGWAVKALIEDQINGAEALAYTGAQAKSPWLSWAAYLWADGATPRTDGLNWVADDFVSDGIHPSMKGRQKVAERLLQFFTTDATATPWFLK